MNRFDTMPGSQFLALLDAGDEDARAYWDALNAPEPRPGRHCECGRFIGAGHCDEHGT